MSNDTLPLDGQTPADGTPNGQTPTPPTPTLSGSQKTSLESLPDDIRDYIARLRTEAEEANKLRKAEARAKTAAEEARLKEQGEFKSLAEKHEQRVKELEPVSERYTSLSALVASQIDAQIQAWPAEIKSLDPGKDAPIETRLAWVEKARPIVAKMAEQVLGRATAPGARPGPKPQGAAGEPSQADLVKAMRGTGKYGF